ncbi:MBL fold metallo-hydrolase, partial [Elusimicrobiota bacterium]
MKKQLFIIFFLLFLFPLKDKLFSDTPDETADNRLQNMISDIHWLGHDSFRIEGKGLFIYIDPYKIETDIKADIILITHEHGDHCSADDIARIRKDDTIIVTVKSAAEKLKGDIRIIKPGDKIEIKDIPIEAVHAYNTNKFRSPGVPFHPKESGHAGYILTVEGIR